MPHTMSVTVPFDQTHRNADGYTMVPFDPEVVGPDPIVIVQPYWAKDPAATVGYTPIVKDIQTINGQAMVLINDPNAAENYFLNVLLIKRYQGDIHGLPTATSQTPKDSTGGLNVPGIGRDMQMPDQVNILTGYGNAIPNASRSMECVQNISPGSDFTNVLTSSGNGDRNGGYWVNNASSEIMSIPHAAQCGIVKKTESSTKVTFTNPWDNPPIVFVTPIAANNPLEIQSVETITNVTPTEFESYSNNKGDDLSLQWLAVTSNPNYHKKHVEQGISHFLSHFPEFTEQVDQNKTTLIDQIINGTPPPDHVARLRATTPVQDPYTTRYDGGQIALDVASLLLDGAGLVLTIIGARSAYVAAKNAKTANAIAAELNGKPSEIRPLLDGVNRLVQRMEEAETAAEKARIQGRIILGLLSSAFTAGLIKIILTKIYQNMSTWQFIVLSVKLATQLAAIVAGAIASAGTLAALEFIAWVGRVASMIMGTTAIGVDLYNLIMDIKKGDQSALA